MKKKSASRSAFLNPRVLIGLALCAMSLVLTLLAFGLYPGGKAFAGQATQQPKARGVDHLLNRDWSKTTVGDIATMTVNGEPLEFRDPGILPELAHPITETKPVSPVSNRPVPLVPNATFVVNNNGDTQDVTPGDGICADSIGNCTLRAAITEANALAGADTITLPAGTYTTTIVGTNENGNLDGDFDINSDLTINGAGSGTTIVQANATRLAAVERVFHVRFTGASTVVTFNDITIRHGNPTGASGGGVRADVGATNVTFTNCVIRDNDALVGGGGISTAAAAGSTTTLNNCTVTNNTAGGAATAAVSGAGIIQGNAAPATLNINAGTTISNNTINNTNAFAAQGGGIFSSGTLNINNATITGNSITTIGGTNINAVGGGILAAGTTSGISGSTISNNTATAGLAGNVFGGGLYAAAGTTTLTSSTVTGNTSAVTGTGLPFAAGIYVQAATLNLNTSSVSANTAGVHAGIRMLSTGTAATMTLTNSTIANNTATLGEGGGIINIAAGAGAATANINSSTVSGNMAAGAGSVFGGIENLGAASTGIATVNLQNSTVSGNSAEDAGGIYSARVAGTATNVAVNLDYTTVARNASTVGDGGGVYQDGAVGAITLRQSIVADNTAAGSGPDIGGTITSGDWNHVEDTSFGTFAPAANDTTGADPNLSPLQNNGGPTFTHMPSLLSGLTVLNIIPNGTAGCGTTFLVDQRGFGHPRPTGAGCEKGSVERVGNDSTPTPTPSGTPTPSPTPTATATATFTPIATPTLTPSPTACGGTFLENFDGVTPPALPSGWIAWNQVGGQPLWVTSNSGAPTPSADSTPNAAFVDDPEDISDKILDSPKIIIPSAVAQLRFSNNYDTEFSDATYWDGGVLEISMNGGTTFQDILAAGGSFVSGGYVGTITTTASNPLGGRQAWSSTSNGWITTLVNLPAAANGQSCVFRWRLGSDEAVSAPGWRIDNVTVFCNGAAPTPSPTPTATSTVPVTPTPTPATVCSLSEDFNSFTALGINGWVTQNLSNPIGTASWFQGNSVLAPPPNGAADSYVGVNFNSGAGTATLSNWLFTPPISFASGAYFTFWTRTVAGGTFPDRLQVRLSTNGTSTNVGASETSVGDFTTLLLDINPTYVSGSGGYPDVWTQFTVPISTVAAKGRLAFRYFVESGGPGGDNSNFIGIDRVRYACGGPTPTPAPTQCLPSLTQSLSQTPAPGSLACRSAFGHAENSYWRSFNMAQSSGGNGSKVSSVSFAVESAVHATPAPGTPTPAPGEGTPTPTPAPTPGTQPVTVRLYTQTTGTFPGGTRTQIASQEVFIANQALTMVTVPLVVTVPAGTTELIMEVFTPNGQLNFNTFFIGSNGAGEHQEGYFSAAACALTSPTTLLSFGVPDMDMIMKVNGLCAFGASGAVTYCTNPGNPPMAGVTMALTGAPPAPASQLTNGSGAYSFSSLVSGSNYTVTPSLAGIPTGSGFIDTTDAIAIQKHALQIATLSGCAALAADAKFDGVVDTTDAISAQAFFLGRSGAIIGDCGQFVFNPVSQSYTPINANSVTNFTSFMRGDVAAGFQFRPEGNGGPDVAASTVASVILPNLSKGNMAVAVKASQITEDNKLVGFQGDLVFDERVVTFEDRPVQAAGLTASNWNVAGNVLPGKGPMRTLRISAYSNDLRPLSGTGALFELRVKSVNQTAQSSRLTWAPSPNQFVFVDFDLNQRTPDNTAR